MTEKTLKELRYFSFFTDDFCEGENVSIWQAILYVLMKNGEDDIADEYLKDINRLEIDVCEDFIQQLSANGAQLRYNDTLACYGNSYNEWDKYGNLLLPKAEQSVLLSELNNYRLQVISSYEEADSIFQSLKLQIRRYRRNKPTYLLIAEDGLRDDFEELLINRESLNKYPSVYNNQDTKELTWADITIVLDYTSRYDADSSC